MLVITGSRSTDVQEVAKINALFLSKLLFITGWDARVIPCSSSIDGVTADSFAVSINQTASQRTIDYLSSKIKMLCLSFGMTSMLSLITESSMEPRIYVVRYTDAKGWFPESVSTVGIWQKSGVPEGLGSWIHYKGDLYFPFEDFKGFDPVQGHAE